MREFQDAVREGVLLWCVFSPSLPLLAPTMRCSAHLWSFVGTVFHRIIADFMIQGGDPTVRPSLLFHKTIANV